MQQKNFILQDEQHQQQQLQWQQCLQDESEMTEMLLTASKQVEERQRQRLLDMYARQQQNMWEQQAPRPQQQKLQQQLKFDKQAEMQVDHELHQAQQKFDETKNELVATILECFKYEPRTCGLEIATSDVDDPKLLWNHSTCVDRFGFLGQDQAHDEEQSSTNDGQDSLSVLDESESDGLSLNWDQSQSRRTTLMVRNLPVMYTQELLVQEWPMDGSYDFLYVPRSGQGHVNLSYAFVNFVSEAHAIEFKAKWQKKRLAHFSSKKALNISFAEVQGLEANMAQLKKKRVRRQCQPVVLNKEQRVAFPALARG